MLLAYGESVSLTICQTWQMLSSATEQMTHGSFKFHEKSLILLVWPPWTNKSSGTPSSASSGLCSSPIRLKSQTLTRRSPELVANTVSLWGDHATWMISSWCPSKVCRRCLRLRKSQRATVYPLIQNPTLSADPVARINSFFGLKDTQLISAAWASTEKLGLETDDERESQLQSVIQPHIIIFLSSPTEANTWFTSADHATSSHQSSKFSYLDPRCMSCIHSTRLQCILLFGITRNIPKANSGVFRCREKMALGARMPRHSIPESVPVTYPSLAWPTKRMSGLQIPSEEGTDVCLVRSKIYTGPITVRVAMISGFPGI